MLYLPQKYSVIEGKGDKSLCTCWSDPNTILKLHPTLTEKCAIISSLYSIEGVSILLRNLFLNPNVKQLFVWSNNPLSKTPIGEQGWKTLLKVWEGDFSSVQKEIDKDALEKLILHVELIDISSYSLQNLHEGLDRPLNGDGIMNQVSFPEPKRNTKLPFPSEDIGWVVRGENILDSWVKTVVKVVRYGNIKKTEYGNMQKEIKGISWVIEEPDMEFLDWNSHLCKKIGLEKDMLDRYQKQFLKTDVPDGTSYTYGQRLGKYPAESVDQIQFLIEKIKSCSNSRRAVATTIFPPIDETLSSPPCLTQIQIIADEKIHLFATFRSQDIFKAGIPNVFGLIGVQKHIATATGFQVGKLMITVNSAHIYEEDWNDAEEIINSHILENKNYFNEKKDMDPRGNINIWIEENNIVAELNSNGESLMSFKGTSARVLMQKIAKLGLLSRSDHLGYVSQELLKAEIALKSSITFIQDKPINLNGFTIN